MRQDASLEGDVVLKALTCEPGEVDSGVDADGFEACAGVAGGWEFGFVENSELIAVNFKSPLTWRIHRTNKC